MKTFRILATLALAACTALTGTSAMAQYPDKPIKFIVPYPPGTGTDTVARYTAKRLGDSLGKAVIVENRPGGNAIIAAQSVVNSPADGYTLLFAANGPVATNVALYNKLPYDPVKNLAPVARLAYGPMGVYVPADSKFKTMKELIDFAKNNPGKLNYGSGSAVYNIATEWLFSLAGAKATGINYKGAAPALTDLAAGLIDFTIADYSGALGLMQGGKIRMLAAASDQRLAAQPSIPTLQELGYKGFFVVAWWGVFAPAETPKPILATLEKTLLNIYGDGETKEFLTKNNYVNFVGNNKVLREFQLSEIERETRLVNEFNIPKN